MTKKQEKKAIDYFTEQISISRCSAMAINFCLERNCKECKSDPDYEKTGGCDDCLLKDAIDDLRSAMKSKTKKTCKAKCAREKRPTAG